MPDFIVTIPKNYQRYLDSNIIRVRSDNASDAKNQIFRTLNIPAAIIDVSTLEEAGGPIVNAATDLSELTETIPQSIGGSGVPSKVVETAYISETGLVRDLSSVLRPVDKSRAAVGGLLGLDTPLNAIPFSPNPFGEGEEAFLPSSPTSSTLTTPSGVDLGAENGTELPIQRYGSNRLFEERRLMDLDALEAENFARQERERLAKIRREAAVVPPVVPEPADMPANLPPYWQERYDEFLNLNPSEQKAVLDFQLKDHIELEPYRSSLSGEVVADSGAAGAELTPEELQKRAQGETTVNNDGSFTFQPGAFTQPMNFEGFPVTSLQDMLNIFYSKPDQFIVDQPVIGTIRIDENGNPVEGIVGYQQSLSPAAQAALQAFSTQRGAESADLASRFGTSTPFGVIAGMGGQTAAADALGLAKLQARAGVTNPYAALGTGSTIGDIGTILRGGLDVDEQLALAGLQARGGLEVEERLAEQRLGILPSLFQATPQALGGLSRVLGGEEALRGALSPFFSGVPAGQNDAQQAAPQQNITQNIPDSPFAGKPINMNIAGPPVTQQPTPSFRSTLADYQGAGMFEQGGIQAEAGMAGQELPKFLGEASPLGTSTARGGLGATTTGRFTY